MFQKKVIEKIKTPVSCPCFFIFLNRVCCEIMWKNTAQPVVLQTTVYNGACTFYARYLRLQIYTQNM